MKSHRGISAVIGTVFLMAIMFGALTFISSSLETTANFSEQLIADESRQKNIQDEKFDLLSVDIVSNKLDATIKNTGDIPIKITTMYLDEMNNQNDIVQKIIIDKTITPGTSFDFFTESIDVDVDSTKGYSMKFISSRGETQTFYLNSASQEPLDIQLIALPDRIPIGFTTTLMMIVVNNMSNNNPLVNLTPVEPNCTGICTKLSGPVPASYDALNPGEVAIFEWTYELDGFNDDSVTFTGELENGYPGNTDSETVTITTVEISELAGQALESSGFGHSEFADDVLILHTGTYGVPSPPVPPVSSIPDPIHNYELNNDATDEMGGSNLVLSDGGSGLNATGWNFLSANDAQIVAGDVPDTEYAIEMVFSFTAPNSYPRILDFHNFEGAHNGNGAEWGFHGYNTDGYGLEFWSAGANGGSVMSTDTLTHVLVQRTSSGTFEAYMDGSLAFSFDDTTNPEATFLGSAVDGASTEQPATFFKDNNNEDSNGFVDCIRIFDEAMSSADAITVTTSSSTCYDFIQIGDGPFQMSPSKADDSGVIFVLDSTNDQFEWFSANATAGDTTISAGNWNASLRYNQDRLPSELDIADIGMKLHFEDISTSTGLYDSGTDPNCYGLAESGNSGVSGATWYPDRGVNGSAAYGFDGNDDNITIQIDGTGAGCLNIHQEDYSVSGWFNATINDDYDTAQSIFSLWDVSGDGGGFKVKINGVHGQVVFVNLDDDGAKLSCYGDEPDGAGGRNYMDSQWHHFVATMSGTECNLYLDGVLKDTNTGGGDGAHWDMDDMDEDYHIGSHVDGTTKEFTGYIDDIMFWYGLEMTQTQVTALKNFSFGNNATRLNFYLNNATGAGTTLDVLAADTNVGLPWTDQGHYTDEDTLWRGGNWTKTLPQIVLKDAEPLNRLNFTISYASGEPLHLRIDDDELGGPESDQISSYLQVPGVDPELPVYRSYDRDTKATFFTYNGEDEGIWFTYQGTRIVFNGTNGHYTGVVDKVNNGIIETALSFDADSPFVRKNSEADITFWHPQNVPTPTQPDDNEKILEGIYDVTVYLTGYDEDGSIVIRSISLGSVLVVE